MIGCHPDPASLQDFAADLDRMPPLPHHSAVLAAADTLTQGCRFRHALSRGGWYRPGGVIRANGERLSDDLEAWIEAELAACGGEFDALVARHADSGLLVTRLTGLTHYFVAPFGARPEEFAQLEVEELQEQVERHLVDPAQPPADLLELSDPLLPRTLAPHAVARPRYRFRRLTDMRQTLARQSAPPGRQSPLARFMDEWQASRAGTHAHFCEHWIITLRAHRDRYDTPQLNATPVSLHARQLKHFPWQASSRDTALAAELAAFDRAAGYPGAWYFHLVAGATAPRDLVWRLAADLKAGYRYLADSEIALLETWIDAPYAV